MLLIIISKMMMTINSPKPKRQRNSGEKQHRAIFWICSWFQFVTTSVSAFLSSWCVSHDVCDSPVGWFFFYFFIIFNTLKTTYGLLLRSHQLTFLIICVKFQNCSVSRRLTLYCRCPRLVLCQARHRVRKCKISTLSEMYKNMTAQATHTLLGWKAGSNKLRSLLKVVGQLQWKAVTCWIMTGASFIL